MGACVSEYQILMLGIGSAGKTTILYRLKLGATLRPVATVGAIRECIPYGDFEFCVWDIGGQDKMLPMWRHWFKGTRGVLFVVDSSDQSNLPKAKAKLHEVARAEELRRRPFLVFANKQDIEGALSAAEIESALDLAALGKGRYHVEPSCAVTGAGLEAGMDWLAREVSKAESNKR